MSLPTLVQRGVVASFNRPGGNATGVYIFGVSAIPKRLELLREILPQPGLIAFLVGPQPQVPPPQLREVEAAAQAIGQPILVLYGREENEIEKAFAAMAEQQVRGLLFGRPPISRSSLTSSSHSLPATAYRPVTNGANLSPLAA